MEPRAAWIAETPERRSLARVAMWAAGTRLWLWAIGYFAVRVGHPRLLHRIRPDFSHGAGVVGWLRWDVGWYLSIVDQGYSFDSEQASNVAFLPGFPATVGLLDRLLHDSIASGLIVANAAFAFAVFALWNWVRECAGLPAAERAAVFLLVYPLSFFFNTIYAEGLFLVFCTLALHRARRGQWLSSGIFASFAAMTRPTGLLLVPAFAWEHARAWRAGRLRWKDVMFSLLPVAGLGAYAAHLSLRFGTPFAVLSAQRTGWSVGGGWSLPALVHHGDLYREVLDVFHLFLPLVISLLSILSWRLGAAAGLYAVLAAGVSVALGGESLGREALSIAPLFAAAGTINLGPAATAATAAVRGGCLALLSLFAYAFAMGHFMG